jgi:hypothetical protein
MTRKKIAPVEDDAAGVTDVLLLLLMVESVPR